MVTAPFQWSNVDEFMNRSDELARMEQWWDSTSRQPLAMLGRRRVGKSWLFRRFAHGKPAVILVAEQLPDATQFQRFADVLADVIGVRPEVVDLPSLFRVLYRAARDERLLVVLDEFPYLLGRGAAERTSVLSQVQAVLEAERDGSPLKLVLCGSQIGQMESMFGERNPMHGRLERLEIRPLAFERATELLGDVADPVERFERYCVTGGMPLYLTRLGVGELRTAVIASVMDQFAPLWDEGRSLVEQELREPRVYFALLERLALGPQQINELAQHAGLDSARASKYLATLTDLRLVERVAPFGAKPDSRDGRWTLVDPFLRFWFRFVFPFQSDIEGGLRSGVLYDQTVAVDLANHCSPMFEHWAASWLRRRRASDALTWGRWWGNAANVHRRSGERSTEEVDVVGAKRGRVTVIAECKWTNKPLTPAIVEELDAYKIPALLDSGLKVIADPKIILFCRSGYDDALTALASGSSRIELVDVPAALGGTF